MTSSYLDRVHILHFDHVHDSDVLKSDTLQYYEIFFGSLEFKDFYWFAHFLLLFFGKLKFFGDDCSIGVDLLGDTGHAQFTFEVFPAVGVDFMALFHGQLLV